MELCDQWRETTHQLVGAEKRDVSRVVRVGSHNHGLNLDLILDMMTDFCRLLSRAVKSSDF